MRRRRSILFAALVGVLLGMQLVQPDAPVAVLPGERPMSDQLCVPPEVDALLGRSCDDCHSAETRWPWYSHVSPISWLIAHDVQHGRSNLDFSRWSTDPVLEPTPVQRLTWMCREVREGVMPPPLYLLVHPGARLDEKEKARLCAWTARARRALDVASHSRRQHP